MNIVRFVVLSILISQYSVTIAQSPCQSNPDPPFGLSSTTTFCAEANEPTQLSFTIFNTGDPGTYEISFPDGTDTTVTNVSATIKISRSYIFNCENMPGNPELPTSTEHYYAYRDELKVTRTDCVDDLGEFSVGYFDFNVVPDPIKTISTSSTDCLSYPYEVDLYSEICNTYLVKDYNWYVDGELLPDSIIDNGNIYNYPFYDAGNHTLKLEIKDYYNCGPYVIEKDINITSDPLINASIVLDSADLCDSLIEIDITNNSEYVDEFQWSSPQGDVSFSDPNSAEPTITIDNTSPQEYFFTVTAISNDCGNVTRTFSIQTFGQQQITSSSIQSCSNTEIELCNYLDFSPDPVIVEWSATDPSVNFSDPNEKCATATFSEAGNFILTVEGEDLCGNNFSHDIEVNITSPQNLNFDFNPIDTLCETEDPIDLTNYITPSDYIVSCNGPGVNNCILDPSVASGNITITFIDSCENISEEQIFVKSQGQFSAGNPEICISEILDLTSLQEGIYSGNGVNNNIFNAEIAGIGTHTIEYQDTSFCGGTDQFSIRVIDKPTADFTIENTPCDLSQQIFPLNEPIIFNNTSSASVLCYKIVENGEEKCNSDDVDFIFNSPGTYTIEQIVETSSGECRDTIQREITIEAPYNPITGSTIDTTDCDSVEISFTIDNINSNYEYEWSFSNGSTANIAEPTLKFPREFSESTIIANLKVRTLCDSVQSSETYTIPEKFQVSVDILNDNNRICSGSTAYFQNTSTNYDSLSIRYKDNLISSEFLDSVIYTNLTDTTQYIPIRIQGFNENCPPEIFTDTLVVFPLNTEASFSVLYDQNSCSPLELTVENSSTPEADEIIYWGDGSSPEKLESLDKKTHTYDFTSDTTVIITVISELCGKDTLNKEVKIYGKPKAGFTIIKNGSPCIGDTIELSATENIPSSSQIKWNFGDSTTSTFPNPTKVYSSAGNFKIEMTVTDSNNCTNQVSKSLTINQYDGVDLEVEAPDILCEDIPFDFQILSSENEIWIDYGNGLVSSDGLPNPYQDAGTYDFSVSSIDSDGCSIDTTISISIISSIEVSIIPDKIDTVLQFGDKILLDFYTSDPSRSIQNIEWKGDSLRNPNLKVTSAMPLNSGYYDLSIKDEYGCMAYDSLYVQLVKEYDERIYIPNAFSPNDDGKNDFFHVFAKPNTVEKIRSFEIYSRWGEKVYECKNCQPNNPQQGWTGYYNQRLMNSGVFLWKTTIEFIDGKVRKYNGDVTLLR